MARGGRNNCRKYSKKRDLSENKGSDESDEDYVVSDEANGASDEYYCSSLDECASEDGFDSFVDEEEEEEGKARKVVRSKSNTSPLVSKKVRSNTVRKRRRFYCAEDEDEDYNVDADEEEEEKVIKLDRSEAKGGSPTPLVIRGPTLQEKRRVHSDKDEDEDYNVDEEEEEDDNEEDSGEYEDDDEEFNLDEDDFSDEEKESRVKKKNNLRLQNQGLQKKGPSRSRKRRRQKNASNKPLTKKRRKNSGLRTTRHSNDDNLIDNSSLVMEVKTKKRPSLRKRRYVAKSDSDFVSSGASDYDYTISEEEREQVREAKELCESLEINLRSSIPKKFAEIEVLRQERKPIRKGKEKVEEVKAVVVKQVCGICLSEEDQRRVRGTLNCCTHYFCFACIMEWAKVESRCPLCKKRFTTISKPARSAAGVDLREAVITVPERDQVYQPSEEELRSYLDPYENVICTECNEGGDDGLMLLCDLCDSPAHTYCVGLGREVPEGNWYCDGCKPVVLASNPQAQAHFTDVRFTTNNSSSNGSTVINNGEGIDLNAISSSRTPFTQGYGNLLSPRFQMGPPTSPISGAAASTLSGRRWRQRNIHQLLMSMNGIASGIPADSLSNETLNTQTDHGGETMLPYQIFLEERLQENHSPSVRYEDVLPLGSVPFRRRAAIHNPSSNTPIDQPLDGTILSPMRRHIGQNQTTYSTDGHINGTLRPELGVGGRSSVSGFDPLNPCSSRLYTGSGNSSLPCTVREDNQVVKEQLQSMIQSHLKKLSQSIDLGQSSSEEISRTVTQTILAACGLDHTSNGAYSLPPPAACSHIELMAGGSISLSKGCCSSCFDSFVGDVVKNIMMDATKSSQWLSLRL